MKIIRPVLFCVLCAIALAAISGLTKELPSEWNQHLLLFFTIIITYGLTILFAKWDGLPLKKTGVVAGKTTLRKLIIGFGMGLLMTFLQPLIVLLLGHYKMTLNPPTPSYTIFYYFTLYLLVALREELAFRGYPLFSLSYSSGLWVSQLIIFLIFSLEHIAGGMTWTLAFLGPGTGALLFGIAALKTRGIALPIGLHAAWNFGQWCLGFKKETGIFHGIAEKGFENTVEINAWISYLIIMAAAIAIFYFYKPKNSFLPQYEGSNPFKNPE
ncbi:MAG TPA: type II CAAX endopeptidase family protein [Chitinophagaceae bacterium]|nr:type II CAAX endopeptidase family protein [Chitinophagaceae bacterium]